MKRLILICLVFALFVPNLYAKRKTEKAGSVKDLVYTDKKYDFKFTIDKGWKCKLRPNKGNYRMVLTQKNYEIPPDYMDAPGFTYVPRLVVYVDTTSMDVFAFLDSLRSEKYSSGQKKDILKEFEILNEQAVEEGTERQKTVTRQRRTITIGGGKAVLWEGQAQYVKYVSTSASSIGGKRVYGAYGGGVVAVKKGNTIVLFHVMSEWDFFASVKKDFMVMVNSFQWGGAQKGKEEKK